MTEITLTDDQAHAITMATGNVVFRDASGNVIARIPPRISDEEWEIIAQSKRRLASGQRRHSTAEVLRRLDSLERQ
jgi:hypothetical protein